MTIARHNSGVRKKETNPRFSDIPVTFCVQKVAKKEAVDAQEIKIEADFGGEILILIELLNLKKSVT